MIMKIMIVEDDVVIATSLKNELNKWAYDVLISENFTSVIEEFNGYKPNLILLDVNLPQLNGYYICKEIRELSNVPIIFISALNEKTDILSAMQMGADDFISKPIDLNITVAKINALIKRTYQMNMDFENLTYKEISLDLGRSHLSYEDKIIELTFTELQIMHELIKNPEKFISKNTLIERCWKNEQFIDENTLAVNLTRLRKKLRERGLDKCIETKKNVGYRLFY